MFSSPSDCERERLTSAQFLGGESNVCLSLIWPAQIGIESAEMGETVDVRGL